MTTKLLIISNVILLIAVLILLYIVIFHKGSPTPDWQYWWFDIKPMPWELITPPTRPVTPRYPFDRTN